MPLITLNEAVTGVFDIPRRPQQEIGRLLARTDRVRRMKRAVVRALSETKDGRRFLTRLEQYADGNIGDEGMPLESWSVPEILDVAGSFSDSAPVAFTTFMAELTVLDGEDQDYSVKYARTLASVLEAGRLDRISYFASNRYRWDGTLARKSPELLATRFTIDGDRRHLTANTRHSEHVGDLPVSRRLDEWPPTELYNVHIEIPDRAEAGVGSVIAALQRVETDNLQKVTSAQMRPKRRQPYTLAEIRAAMMTIPNVETLSVTETVKLLVPSLPNALKLKQGVDAVRKGHNIRRGRGRPNNSAQK